MPLNIARLADINDLNEKIDPTKYPAIRDVDVHHLPALDEVRELIRQFGTAQTGATQLKIKQFAGKARRAEAEVSKEAQLNRYAYMFLNNKVRGLQGQMRHATNMGGLQLRLEESLGQYNTDVQQFGLQINPIREGQRSFTHEMQKGWIEDIAFMSTALGEL